MSDELIGVDLKLNSGDLGYTNTGDLALIGDTDPIDNVWQSVELRLMTTMETYLFADGYGTHLKENVDEPITDQLMNDITSKAKTTILQDNRVSQIYNFSVASAGSQIKLSFGISTISGETKYDTVTIGG